MCIIYMQIRAKGKAKGDDGGASKLWKTVDNEDTGNNLMH